MPQTPDRRSFPLRIVIAGLSAALIALCAVAFLTGRHDSDAAFPGANGLIVFDSDRFDDEQIFVIDPSGGSAEQLTFEDRNYSPAWSADATRIAFVSDRSGGDIWVMNADGSQQTNLTNEPGSNSAPAWSPDGNTIVFTRRVPNVLDIEIWTVPADGGTPAPFLASAGVDSTAAFSPDGTRIAFGHSPAADQDLDIYVADVDGSNPVQLTDNDTNDLRPNWSPDGTRIAYDCRGPGDQAEVCVLDAEDGGSQQILRPGGVIESEPAWSPDGTRIVFESSPLIGGTSGIYTTDTSGGDIQPITVQSDYEPDWGVAAGGTPTTTSGPTSTPSSTPSGTLIHGDIDCDGDLDEDDMLDLLLFLEGFTGDPGCRFAIGELVTPGLVWGDADCDTTITLTDALWILREAGAVAFPTPDGCHVLGTLLDL